MRMQMKPLGDEGALFRLEGELDAYTGPPLRDDLGRAIEEGARWLFVDLSAVQYIDSVGLGILVGAAKRAVEQEGNLAVLGPPPQVLRVFEVSGTSELLNVVICLEEAQTKLGCPPLVRGEGEEK